MQFAKPAIVLLGWILLPSSLLFAESDSLAVLMGYESGRNFHKGSIQSLPNDSRIKMTFSGQSESEAKRTKLIFEGRSAGNGKMQPHGYAMIMRDGDLIAVGRFEDGTPAQVWNSYKTKRKGKKIIGVKKDSLALTFSGGNLVSIETGEIKHDSLDQKEANVGLVPAKEIKVDVDSIARARNEVDAAVTENLIAKAIPYKKTNLLAYTLGTGGATEETVANITEASQTTLSDNSGRMSSAMSFAKQLGEEVSYDFVADVSRANQEFAAAGVSGIHGADTPRSLRPGAKPADLRGGQGLVDARAGR